MENEWNVYAYFRFIHYLVILEDSCVLSQILKQLKSQLRQMQCNYFLNTSQTQTWFSLYAESQTELELIIHPNELGVKTSQYQETLESLLGNNDSSIYIPVIEEGNKEKLHNTPIYKSLSRLGANEEISSNIALQTSIYKNCIKVVINDKLQITFLMTKKEYIVFQKMHLRN